MQLRSSIGDRDQMPEDVTGASPGFRAAYELLKQAAGSHISVLLCGETGVGKEVFARSLHEMSPRGDKPFVAVNCAAIPHELVESELFGVEKGAYTGALVSRPGRFERADGGTLFLDEIGDLPASAQAKLLRVLEGHSFQRLRGNEDINVDVRMIAATHRNLPEMIEQRRFREDLYYRLRVIDIKMPPLRDRNEDVIELAAMFVESFRSQMGRGPLRLSKAAISVLRGYRWPGNVRELKNAVERAVVLGQGEEMQVADLGLPSIVTANAAAPEMITLKEAEERHIKWVLERCDGNKTQACKVLGIGRATLYSKLGSE